MFFPDQMFGVNGYSGGSRPGEWIFDILGLESIEVLMVEMWQLAKAGGKGPLVSEVRPPTRRHKCYKVQ